MEKNSRLWGNSKKLYSITQLVEAYMMKKVYDLTDESAYFYELWNIYVDFLYSNYDTSFISSNIMLDYAEVLNFCTKIAESGVNVYILGFPRQVQVLRRPDTLFFLERWSDFLDISDLDHALNIAIVNRHDHHKTHETFIHIQQNFKSFCSIMVEN